MVAENIVVTDLDYSENHSTYLLDEFEKIHLMLQYAVRKARNDYSPKEDSFHHLFISDKEIDLILEPDSCTVDEQKSLETLRTLIRQQQEKISSKVRQCEERGLDLPMVRLKKCFDLTQFEIDVLLVCLAPIYNPGYEKVYAYLQDDASQKRPTLHLIDCLLADTFVECCQHRDFFSSHLPLIKWRLVQPVDGEVLHSFDLSTPIRIDDRIAAFLTGSTLLDSRVESCLRVLNSELKIDEMMLADDLKASLLKLGDSLCEPKSSLTNHLIAFYGTPGSGKKQSATAICNTVGIPLLALKLAPIINDPQLFRNSILRVTREVLILGTGLIIEDYDLIEGERSQRVFNRDFLLEQIQNNCWLCFLNGTSEVKRPNQISRCRFIGIHFPVPGYLLRVEIWNRVLSGQQHGKNPRLACELANRFQFNEKQIRNARTWAYDNSFVNPIRERSIAEEDLERGCWAQCNQALAELALKIETKSGWKDLVLPQEQMELLREVCSHFKYKSIVYHQWGFDEKVTYGKGLSVLFSGPSGTGKTMAAGIVAQDLKLELYKIDLSSVVSKYIGETEKNLARIFKEAETSNAILFFDEADALFGKRSEITNAHDRYANIETGYLLQKMEEYEGITILASNFRQNMDQAFTRRMQFIVEFPFPDQKLRERLWRGAFPDKAPLQNNLDYEFLSSRLKLAGGNIKNIAVNASFYAAEEETEISIQHIIQAAKREYLKLGMSFVKSDMSPYIDLITEGRD